MVTVVVVVIVVYIREIKFATNKQTHKCNHEQQQHQLIWMCQYVRPTDWLTICVHCRRPLLCWCSQHSETSMRTECPFVRSLLHSFNGRTWSEQIEEPKHLSDCMSNANNVIFFLFYYLPNPLDIDHANRWISRFGQGNHGFCSESD